MTVLAIIPARGNSKGIQNKNMMEIAGKPMLDWTIEAAGGARMVDRVVVSSDSKEILDHSKGFGFVTALKRPADLATDEAATDPVLIHAAKEMGVKGQDDYIVCLQPTSPLRTAETIDRAIDKCKRTGSDACLTLTRGPIFVWSRNGDDSPGIDGLQPVNCTLPYRVRRQDLRGRNIVWAETGSVYVTRARVLLKYRQRLTGSVTCIEVDRRESLEVDTLYDAWLANHHLMNPATMPT